MTTASPARVTRFRFGWLVLLVVALIVRSAAPAGWMPVVSASGGIEITVCNGDAPLVLAKDGSLHKQVPKGEAHDCAFAGMGVASAPPPQVAIDLPIRTANTAPIVERLAITPGRGLAAPPPPATGPPALA